MERMNPRQNRPSAPPEETEAPADSVEAQLDFFRKLGYSPAQVRSALQNLGLNPDTNRVLGELVRSGASPGEGGGPLGVMVLVPRRDNPARTSVSLPVSAAPGREEPGDDGDALRPIVIDGSNVAMSHGNKEVFSCLGIQLAVNFFLERGHPNITVFVPSWRKEQPRPDVPITDQHILRELEKRKILVFTPSRRVAGKRVVCYDDRFIVKLAHESDGVIVSNDTYRDLQGERAEWKRFIEDRLLMYSFVNDKFMPPDDPLGRHGPTLDNFLRKVPVLPRKQQCPYGKKCTYGIKCKFYHPERASQSSRSLADELRERARLSSPTPRQAPASPGPGPGLSLEEEMAQKLTLEPWSGTLKNAVAVKGGHRPARRPPSKRDKAGQPDPSSPRAGSYERLDSGLGSIESQASWDPSERFGNGCRSGMSSPGGSRQHYCPPNNPPCGCCSLGTSVGFQHRGPQQHQSRGPAGAFCPPRYAHYGASMYPASVHAYGHPNDFQPGVVRPSQQAYLSDPFGAYPQALCSGTAGGERAPWSPPPPPPPQGGGRTMTPPREEERGAVRKKLLAIFNPRLVDGVMDMFPQVMDAQRLAAEIVTLQSQGL